MKYKIFDTQLKDYVAPYHANEYWTLEDAADLAYRRWEEAANQEEEGSAKDYAYQQMSKMLRDPDDIQVKRALQVFDYEMRRVEQ